MTRHGAGPSAGALARWLSCVAAAALLASCAEPAEEPARPPAATTQAATAQDDTTQDAATPDGTTSATTDSPGVDELRHPDVLEAELSRSGEQFMIAVTLSSPYDSPERYADGWRVLSPDGEVLAEHDLAHHHADEQPFTRSRGPFPIPEGVSEVMVEGRDLVHGYGGATVSAPVPR